MSKIEIMRHTCVSKLHKIEVAYICLKDSTTPKILDLYVFCGIMLKKKRIMLDLMEI